MLYSLGTLSQRKSTVEVENIPSTPPTSGDIKLWHLKQECISRSLYCIIIVSAFITPTRIFHQGGLLTYTPKELLCTCWGWYKKIQRWISTLLPITKSKQHLALSLFYCPVTCRRRNIPISVKKQDICISREHQTLLGASKQTVSF